MKYYSLFLFMATATVLSPGPGVVMTLTNSLRHGMKETFSGIVGISFGALTVATISATSLGIVLVSSAFAFNILKFIGAIYLIYLGIKLWRAPAYQLQEQYVQKKNIRRCFLEGLSLQLTNPKVIFFFISVFPQFIDSSMDYSTQFAVQVVTYSSLVIVIHCLYALFAQKAKYWLTSKKGSLAINRVGAAMFIFFATVLASTKN